MSDANKISFKRGDTFAFYANITIDGTTPLVTSVANIRSQVRTTTNALIDELVVTTTATQGEYLLTAGATDTWGVGVHNLDIEITIDGVISSSDTILVEVLKDVTKPIVVTP